MNKLAGTILGSFCFFQALGQLNYSWHFGSTAGLRFIPNGVQSVPSAITNSAMVATEGSASICDDRGNTLFYTNGRIIYNRFNAVMLNGNNLMGHESAFQSVIIVPLPNSTHLYYVFTADAIENDFQNGYRYSIVDMDLDGGRGAVTVKNNLLYAPSSERLTAARHANGIDAWVIMNDSSSNTFRSWLLTCNGLAPSPVISTVGAKMDQYITMNTGAMKVSPDGKQLCHTHFPNPDGSGDPNFFQVFDFNNATGVLSNARTISFNQSRYFSCEFSPNSELLYITKADEATVDQYRCKQSTAQEILNTLSLIPAASLLCGIQLAPDRKIYFTTISSRLSVISQPDVPGILCRFELDKVDLLGNYGSLNLPSFINDMSFDGRSNFNLQVVDTCRGIVQFNGFTDFTGPVAWNWDFGDGGSSTLQNPQHVFSDINQLYTVRLTIAPAALCGFITRTRFVFPAGLVTECDFEIFNKCDSGYVRFENHSASFPEASIQYLWDFGDGITSTDPNPTHTYASPGDYPVKLKLITPARCLDDSISRVVAYSSINVQASPDIIINEGESIQIHAAGNSGNLSWSPAIWLNSATIADPIASPPEDIRYIVTATSAAGCKDSDTIFIKVNPKSDIFIPSAFTPNNDGLNDVFKPKLSMQYKIRDFTVYNRWGQAIFSTTTRDNGWNGRVNGIFQDAGVYAWILRVTDRGKQEIEKHGTVTLIR